LNAQHSTGVDDERLDGRPLILAQAGVLAGKPAQHLLGPRPDRRPVHLPLVHPTVLPGSTDAAVATRLGAG
jgi:hypothetical protein